MSIVASHPFRCFVLACVVAGVSARARAQADAGPDPCTPHCSGDTLAFCDGDAATTLDCRSLDASCGLLSDAWGDDCLLRAGAACEPGYAFGASRCDARSTTAALFCIDGACVVADGPAPAPTETPTAGTEVGAVANDTSPFGCLNCGNFGLPALLPVLWWRNRRALLRRRSHRRTELPPAA